MRGAQFYVLISNYSSPSMHFLQSAPPTPNSSLPEEPSNLQTVLTPDACKHQEYKSLLGRFIRLKCYAANHEICLYEQLAGAIARHMPYPNRRNLEKDKIQFCENNLKSFAKYLKEQEVIAHRKLTFKQREKAKKADRYRGRLN